MGLEAHWLREAVVTARTPADEIPDRRAANIEFHRLRQLRLRLRNNAAAKRSRAAKQARVEAAEAEATLLRRDLAVASRQRDALLELCNEWGADMQNVRQRIAQAGPPNSRHPGQGPGQQHRDPAGNGPRPFLQQQQHQQLQQQQELPIGGPVEAEEKKS